MVYIFGMLFAFAIGYSAGWQRSKKKMYKKIQSDWRKVQTEAIDKIDGQI